MVDALGDLRRSSRSFPRLHHASWPQRPLLSHDGPPQATTYVSDVPQVCNDLQLEEIELLSKPGAPPPRLWWPPLQVLANRCWLPQSTLHHQPSTRQLRLRRSQTTRTSTRQQPQHTVPAHSHAPMERHPAALGRRCSRTSWWSWSTRCLPRATSASSSPTAGVLHPRQINRVFFAIHKLLFVLDLKLQTFGTIWKQVVL
jgi:hypothetical protein